MTFIKKYSNSNSITLKKYEGDGLEVVNKEHEEKTLISQDNIRIAFLDLETTGTDINKLGYRNSNKAISINKIDGSSLAAINEYESLNEPSIPISEEITKINGITNEMVAGKRIDWNLVDTLLSECHLVVAHN